MTENEKFSGGLMGEITPQIIETVNAMMHENFEIPQEQLVPTAHLRNDLKLDSLDFVDMIVLLESKTGKTVENIDIPNTQTLADIYKIAATSKVKL